jgi:error-prone DNA polymerase
MPDYVELHCHSAFSLLDGAATPETLVTQAAALGYTALALTDHNELGGFVRFAQAAHAVEGFKAIIGAEVTVGAHHLVLLAETREGYGNLSTLITRGRMDSPRGHPSVSLDLVARHAAGLTALTGCPRGWVPSALVNDGPHVARAAAGTLLDIFGREHLAIECWDHGVLEEREIVRGLIPIARAIGAPWVVANDVHYAEPRLALVHDVLACLRHQSTLDDMGTRLKPNAEWYLKSAAEIRRQWVDPAGMRATVAIAERCAFGLDDLQPTLPRFPVEEPDVYLAELVERGAAERWGAERTDIHQRQLQHELAMITQLGYAGFFLIVWDIMRFAREHGILAQGRGSAANSAVCYCLGITAVDPIKMGLLFERFLSEGRKEPPDIDLDFAHRERERVIQYVYERYGREHAAMVCEQITYRGRSAVRDAARVFGFSVEQAGMLADISDRFTAKETAETLRDAEDGLTQAGLDANDKRVGLLANVVEGLHQLPRHRSIHVGGFVLTKEPLSTVVPIEPASMPERTVIQWERDDLEGAGLIKIDLLGLGMLTLLQDCLLYIKETRGIAIDLAHLDMFDKQVYDSISRADTIGVFQIESRAQMQTLPRLQPRCFYDLVIEVAIIRPGPIQGDMVHPYLRRRAGVEEVTYPHPKLRPILERTLGVPLFQEQGMQVAISCAGFSPGEADNLRRAMGHKRSREKMAAIHDALVNGMIANGIATDLAERIYKQINGFADYGFPESHAASFALLVYASAFLRYYYAPEFLAAILNAQPMGFYAAGTLVEDARHHGVEVRPIDLTRSDWDCTLERDTTSGIPATRLGLRCVRGLGSAARDALARARAEGPFVSVDDFVRRVRLNQRAVRQLAEAGVFDTIVGGTRREALWHVLEALRGTGGPLVVHRPAAAPAALPPMAPYELTAADYRTTGLSLNGHPMIHIRETVRLNGVRTAQDIVTRGKDGERIATAGLVICRQRPGTAKGFVFLTLEDETGTVNIVVTPKRFQQQAILISRTPLLLVRGVLQIEDGVVNLRAEQFKALDAPVGAEHAQRHDFH